MQFNQHKDKQRKCKNWLLASQLHSLINYGLTSTTRRASHSTGLHITSIPSLGADPKKQLKGKPFTRTLLFLFMHVQ